MAQVDEQFVRQVVEQVFARMRQQTQQQPAATPATPPREQAPLQARLHPPAGVCTGDYSKFEELRGSRSLAPAPPQQPAPQASPAPQSQNDSEPAPAALTGIITAEQLRQAMEQSGVVLLAESARLTPLAQDLAREKPQRVRRGSSEGGTTSAGQAAGTWLWWADGHCPGVQAVTGKLQQQLRPSAASRSDLGLVQVIGDLARQVYQGQSLGGLLFVRHAARALCYANRCPQLRAIPGTCLESVEQGIAELGANVLVIEYPHVGVDKMAAMVRQMVQQSPKVPADVKRHLGELGCR